jgi:hypothetical protein
MDTFLPPIEKPQGLLMKLVYATTRQQFGKVLTPMKVAYARLPLAFGMFVSKTATVVGDDPANPRTGGAAQCLSFLHRYC